MPRAAPHKAHRRGGGRSIELMRGSPGSSSEMAERADSASSKAANLAMTDLPGRRVRGNACNRGDREAFAHYPLPAWISWRWRRREDRWPSTKKMTLKKQVGRTSDNENVVGLD